MNPELERPFVAMPDKTDSPPMNELVCFLDKDRACGPDCMSFTTNTPGSEYVEPSFHCMYLTSLHRMSKHMIILAQLLDSEIKLAKTTAADNVRASNMPVVPPFTPPIPKKVDP